MADIIDIFRRFRTLSDDDLQNIETLKKYLSKKDINIIKGFIKEKKIIIIQNEISIGGLIDGFSVPILKNKVDDLNNFTEEINSKINERTNESLFSQFSKIIHKNLDKIIAPKIVGFENVKKAVALQLFSPEHIHILLLGDPGTGKTDILSSAKDLAPISSMGLGSGTSGVGLAVTVKGKEIMKGLLPSANNGLCAIDELNLMKEESRASLYNAMEKGFVSYDKGGHSYKFDAKISVLATANPKGDKFTGKTVNELKKQLPFDAALLSRFHLTFLIRKHTVEEFKAISRALVSRKKTSRTEQEILFLKSYVEHTKNIPDIKIPKQFENDIVDFVGKIKENENLYLVEISPRLVVGITRLAKASARMALRDIVEKEDIDLILMLIKESLKI